MVKAQTYAAVHTLDRKTEDWLRAIEPFNDRERSLEGAAAALLVVDMQRIFLEEGNPLACENSRVVIPRVKRLLDAFRSAKRPVLYLAQMHKAVDVDRGRQLAEWWTTPPLEGTPAVEIVPELAPRPEEKVIPKRRYGGFHATDLDLTLRVMGVRDVVVCGVFTNVCVEGTARDAFMHDYRVFVPADATAALTEDLHVGSLRTLAGWFAKVVTTADVCRALAPG